MKDGLLLEMKKKVHSKTGASLVLALLFFLMCAMVGSVVLTTASATSGRSLRLTEDTQEQYTLESAARLIAKQLDGNTFTYTNPVTENYNVAFITPSLSNPTINIGDSICTKILGSLFGSVTDSLWNSIYQERHNEDFFPIELSNELSFESDPYKILLRAYISSDPADEFTLKPVVAEVYHKGFDVVALLKTSDTSDKTISVKVEGAAVCDVSGSIAHVDISFKNPVISSRNIIRNAASTDDNSDSPEETPVGG